MAEKGSQELHQKIRENDPYVKRSVDISEAKFTVERRAGSRTDRAPLPFTDEEMLEYAKTIVSPNGERRGPGERKAYLREMGTKFPGVPDYKFLQLLQKIDNDYWFENRNQGK